MTRLRVWVGVMATFGVLAAASPSQANPITYAVSAIASGTLGGSAFTNALVTVTLVGDTSAVFQPLPADLPALFANPGTATVTVDGANIGSFPVGPDGTFSFDDPASGTIVVTCGGVTLTFEVGGAGGVVTTASGGDLARTGADSAPLARVAIALTAVGGIVLLAARRRMRGIEA